MFCWKHSSDMKLSRKEPQVVTQPPHVQAIKATRGRGRKVVSKVARSIKQCLPCTTISRSPSATSRPGAKQQSRDSVGASQSLAALCKSRCRPGEKHPLTSESATEQQDELLQVLEEQATAALTEAARQQLEVEQQKHEAQLAQARAQHVEQLQAHQEQHSAALMGAAEQHKQHLLLQEQKHLSARAEARLQLTNLKASHYDSMSAIEHQHEQLLSKLQLDGSLANGLARSSAFNYIDPASNMTTSQVQNLMCGQQP